MGEFNPLPFILFIEVNMFKKVIVVVGIILLALNGCSKKDDNSRLITKYIQIDRIINTGCQFEGTASDLKFAVFQNKIFTYPTLSEGCLELKLYDIKSEKFSIKSFALRPSITDSIKYYIGKAPSDIDVNSRFVFLLYDRFLLAINKCEPKNSYLTYFGEPFQNLKVLNGKIMLWRAYDYNPLDAKTPLRIAEYDIKSKRIINFIDPIQDAVEFSFLSPLKWIDISTKGDIAYTNTLKPIHYFYDADMNLKQKLLCNLKTWKNIDIVEFNTIRKKKSDLSPIGFAQELMKLDEGNGCRVISINFANDSTLLAFYTGPSASDKANFVRYCNVWKKKNDKWILFDKELKDGNPDSTTILSKSNFPFIGSLHTVKFYKNKAYYIYISPNQDKLLQFGKPYSAVNKAIDKFFAEDKLYYQLFVFDCRF